MNDTCRHEVMRPGGYWTGKKCGRKATWKVTTEREAGTPDTEHFVCGTHKNLLLRNKWFLNPTAEKLKGTP